MLFILLYYLYYLYDTGTIISTEDHAVVVGLGKYRWFLIYKKTKNEKGQKKRTKQTKNEKAKKKKEKKRTKNKIEGEKMANDSKEIWYQIRKYIPCPPKLEY